MPAGGCEGKLWYGKLCAVVKERWTHAVEQDWQKLHQNTVEHTVGYDKTRWNTLEHSGI